MVQIGDSLDQTYTLAGSDGEHNTQTLQDMSDSVKILPPEDISYSTDLSSIFQKEALSFAYTEPQLDNAEPVTPRPEQDMSFG